MCAVTAGSAWLRARLFRAPMCVHSDLSVPHGSVAVACATLGRPSPRRTAGPAASPREPRRPSQYSQQHCEQPFRSHARNLLCYRRRAGSGRPGTGVPAPRSSRDVGVVSRHVKKWNTRRRARVLPWARHRLAHTGLPQYPRGGPKHGLGGLGSALGQRTGRSRTGSPPVLLALPMIAYSHGKDDHRLIRPSAMLAPSHQVVQPIICTAITTTSNMQSVGAHGKRRGSEPDTQSKRTLNSKLSGLFRMKTVVVGR